MRLDRSSSSDRRGDDGLVYDPDAGTLTMGAYQSNLRPAAGNRAVLEAYVDLAGRARGDRVEDIVEVRQADVDALARALDLDAADLATQMESMLGASREQAQRLVARLKEYRLIGGIAAAATGAAVAGALAVGAAAPAPSSHTPQRTTGVAMRAAGSSTKPTATPPSAPVVETSDGVGLVDPITEDGDGTGLIPPTNVDRDLGFVTGEGTALIPPASVDRPTPTDG